MHFSVEACLATGGSAATASNWYSCPTYMSNFLSGVKCTTGPCLSCLNHFFVTPPPQKKTYSDFPSTKLAKRAPGNEYVDARIMKAWQIERMPPDLTHYISNKLITARQGLFYTVFCNFDC